MTMETMILVLRSVISRRSFIFQEGGINRKEISCRTGKGPFSCLESSYSSEALDSFGWRSAVLFFCGGFRLFTLRLFLLGSFLASYLYTIMFFFGFFFPFLMSNFVNNLFSSPASAPFPPQIYHTCPLRPSAYISAS